MTHKPGDIIQFSGTVLAREVEHAWFIVREVAEDGSLTLSWPYADRECSELYIPRDNMTSGRWRKRCQELLKEEQAAGNKAARFVTEYRPVR